VPQATILARYQGMVQGVGFRATSRRLAQSYALKGWVKNESDGSVSLLVHGEAAEVQAFLQDIRDSRLGPGIEREELEPQNHGGPWPAFGVLP